MKCPVCGETLRPGKKDPNYLLCYTCKKKYKVPGKKTVKKEEQKYSNIPPKTVRKKREKEMKKAYDEMLSVEEEYQEDKVSVVPIVVLTIAILAVAGIIAYMLLK